MHRCDNRLANRPGTYALLLRAPAAQSIEVGRLGVLRAQSGWYVYAGSAFGPGGVQARVRRHARAAKSPHWHVDYLRVRTTLEAVWYTYDDEPRECAWARVLRALSGNGVPIEGFGASDCGCAAHLAHFTHKPALRAFREHIRGQCPDHAPIFCAVGEEIAAT